MLRGSEDDLRALFELVGKAWLRKRILRNLNDRCRWLVSDIRVHCMFSPRRIGNSQR